MTEVEKNIKEVKEEIKRLPEFLDKFYEKNSQNLGDFFKGKDVVYFVGCGSSYYLAIAASRYFSLKLGIETKAVPAGEIVFAYPENAGKESKKSAVLISRSGETTEVLYALEKFKENGVKAFGITLGKDSSLEKDPDISIVLPMEEKPVVMTKSFVSMLFSLEYIASKLSGNVETLRKLVDDFESSFEKIKAFVSSKKELFGAHHHVFLGEGVYEGVARECALKLEEMSITKTESYSALEYRHGPKALVEKGVAVHIFKKGLEEEEKLKKELKEMGAIVVDVESDIGLSSSYPEDAFLKVVYGQFLGLKIAEEKGVNVDSPRNLTRVVKMN
ncbi:MAG: SIS domain-containing protein [Thermotogaceae bacterium]|nr:SIS domain-containing protein [Thermotogaceae bacterium]